MSTEMHLCMLNEEKANFPWVIFFCDWCWLVRTIQRVEKNNSAQRFLWLWWQIITLGLEVFTPNTLKASASWSLFKQGHVWVGTTWVGLCSEPRTYTVSFDVTFMPICVTANDEATRGCVELHRNTRPTIEPDLMTSLVSKMRREDRLIVLIYINGRYQLSQRCAVAASGLDFCTVLWLVRPWWTQMRKWNLQNYLQPSHTHSSAARSSSQLNRVIERITFPAERLRLLFDTRFLNFTIASQSSPPPRRKPAVKHHQLGETVLISIKEQEGNKMAATDDMGIQKLSSIPLLTKAPSQVHWFLCQSNGI